MASRRSSDSICHVPCPTTASRSPPMSRVSMVGGRNPSHGARKWAASARETDPLRRPPGARSGGLSRLRLDAEADVVLPPVSGLAAVDVGAVGDVERQRIAALPHRLRVDLPVSGGDARV